MINETIKIRGLEYKSRYVRKKILNDAIDTICRENRVCMCAAIHDSIINLFKKKFEYFSYEEMFVLKSFLFPDFHRMHFTTWYQSSGRKLYYNGTFYWIDIQDKQTRIDFLKHLIHITDEDTVVFSYLDERIVKQQKPTENERK